MKILGFDIGVASIGWAFVEKHSNGEIELKDCGVRIFTEAKGKNGDSLALPRREARGARRRIRRRTMRLEALKKLICNEFGLNYNDYIACDGELPKAYKTDKDTKSPYKLRYLALQEKLDSKDLARVILHIAKRRGYWNKHARDNKKDTEKDKVKSAIKENLKKLKEGQVKYQTWGEYLYKEYYEKNLQIRNKDGKYEHCVSQELLKEELEIIFDKQRKFGANLSNDFTDKILKTTFHQRPLKSFGDMVGNCIFFENEKRAPKDSLSAIEFIALSHIINTLHNLSKQSGEVYGKETINGILNLVLDKGKLNYATLREKLKLDSALYFNDNKLDYSKGQKEAESSVNFIEFKTLNAFKKSSQKFKYKLAESQYAR